MSGGWGNGGIHSQDGGCVEVMETVYGDVAIMSLYYTEIIEAGVRNEAVSRGNDEYSILTARIKPLDRTLSVEERRLQR